jgi:hypothetical protein
MAIDCLNGKSCLCAVYDFCSKSKIGVTICLVGESALLIIGILGMMNVLPGVNALSAAPLVGLGWGFLIITIALVCCRSRTKETDISEEDKVTDRESSSEDTASSTESKQPKHHWKEKLERLRVERQTDAEPISDVPPQECLSTLAYLAQGGLSSQLFKKTLPVIEPTSKKMKSLMKKCQTKTGKKLYLSIAKNLLKNLPSLNQFLRSQTQEILLHNSTEEGRKNFKCINQQIRTILLFLISNEPLKSNYLKRYLKYLSNSFGNRPWNSFDYTEPFQPCHYCDRLADLNEYQEQGAGFSRFLFLFSGYRRHALFHLFPEKITTHAKSQDAGLKTLLSASWFHGTRAVVSLKGTDFILLPTGWLHEIGLFSFFGEMLEGCQKNGINANSLSGTYLDHVDWAIGAYAIDFQFDIECEMKKIEWFLNLPIDTNQREFHTKLIGYSKQLPRVEVALKRWRCWDQETFREKVSSLSKKLNDFKQAIDIIEEKQPEEIFNWHDDTSSSRYKNICHSIAQIESILSSPLPAQLTEGEKKNIENNFPAVLGSLTLLPEPTSYDDAKGEHTVRGMVELGKDLQLLCVEKNNLERAQKWVSEHLPDSNIQLFTFEQLKEAQKINKVVSPYLADILSFKKFQKLCVA